MLSTGNTPAAHRIHPLSLEGTRCRWSPRRCSRLALGPARPPFGSLIGGGRAHVCRCGWRKRGSNRGPGGCGDPAGDRRPGCILGAAVRVHRHQNMPDGLRSDPISAQYLQFISIEVCYTDFPSHLVLAQAAQSMYGEWLCYWPLGSHRHRSLGTRHSMVVRKHHG